MNKMPAWVWGSAVLAALLSLFGLYFRHKVESANKAVGLAVEGHVVAELASASGMTFDDALAVLKEAGATGVALTEETGGQLIQDGKLQLEEEDYPDGTINIGIKGTDSTLRRFDEAASARIGDQERQRIAQVPDAFNYRRAIGLSPEFLRATSIGINERQSKSAQDLDLEIIARYTNPSGLSERYLDWLWDDAASKGATWFLPAGEQMLGRRTLTENSIEAMRERGIGYLTAEFVKIAGDSQVRSEYKENTLRLHAIPPSEIEKMSESAVLERYGKAWRERQIRWLLVRPFSTSVEDPITEFANHIKRVREGIRSQGGDVRTPRSFEEPQTPRWLFPLIALACVPGMAWLASVFIRHRFTLPVAGVLLGLAALATWSAGFRSEFALLAAIAMPTIGFAWLFNREKPPGVLSGFAVLTAFSLVGGLVVASTLVGVSYTLQNQQFSGIKIAHFLPLLLAGFLAVNSKIDWRKAMKEPVVWGAVFTCFVALGLVGFMLLRTGNESPGAVSGLELKFRSLLEGALYTRPRTKEFLIGHPALFVGLSLLAMSVRHPRLWALGAAFAVLGAIGQTSMINTLCHLHTPVMLSLIRIMIGLILGGIIGAACWGAVKLAVRPSSGESS